MDIRPIWREASRVSRVGGISVSQCANPVAFLFDNEPTERNGRLELKGRLPFPELERQSEVEIEGCRDEGVPLGFSHSLEDRTGGRIAAGFLITGFHEDHDRTAEDNPLGECTPTYFGAGLSKPA